MRTMLQTFEVEPVSGVIGAEIHGLDIAVPLDEDTVRELRDAFNQHQVIFFRDQRLTPEQQIAFGRRFGELGTHPYVVANTAHPEVIDIVTEPDDRVNFGGGWHTDVTFLPEPDLG
jgi:taurine dioxygenase